MFEKLLNIFKKDSSKPMRTRRFIGSRNTRWTKWIDSTLSKINLDTDTDLLQTITKCRDLAKNSPIVRAYLSACVKNIIGKTGFSLQCQVKSSEDQLDAVINDAIEWAWYDFGKLSNGYLTMDGGSGHNELDALILRTLIIDGEVFIRIHHPNNKYGLSFEIVDSASIDYTKRREFAYAGSEGTAIVLGVEIDKYYKAVKYYLRPRNDHRLSSRKRRSSPSRRDHSHLQKRVPTAGPWNTAT